MDGRREAGRAGGEEVPLADWPANWDRGKIEWKNLFLLTLIFFLHIIYVSSMYTWQADAFLRGNMVSKLRRPSSGRQALPGRMGSLA